MSGRGVRRASGVFPRLLVWSVGLFLGLGSGLLPGSFGVRGAAAEDRVLAIFLPGVHFASLEQRLELGNELSGHLQAKLGERYRLTAQAYASGEAMEADKGRVALALVEAPYVAARLTSVLPVSVAIGGAPGGVVDQTRLLVMASGGVKAPPELRRVGLTFALPLENPQVFLENFLLEGELTVPRVLWQSTRDVASALSLASLRKAEAVLLYEDDAAVGRQAGLKPLFVSERLPRPTLVLLDRKADAAEVARLREALSSFRGQVLPTLRAFHAANEAQYGVLRARMDKRPVRTPQIADLQEDQAPLPTPKPTSAPGGVPLRAYLPPE